MTVTAVVAFAMLVTVLATLFFVMGSIWGCAICDNSPPSYFGAFIGLVAGTGACWGVFRAGRWLVTVLEDWAS
jgi:hypothetical protein